MKTQLVAEFNDFILSHDVQPFISIRENKAKIKFEPEQKSLFLDSQKVDWCDTGYYLNQRPTYINDPLYHAGVYYPQEPSSMILAQLMDNSQPLKVLDMCAAPGGKTLIMADYLHPQSLIVANEFDGKRVGKLVENITRWGRDNIIVTHNRPADFGKTELREQFDIVLVDAPCSGEGMFRKDQFAIDQWSEKLIGECVARQRDILFYSLSSLKVGGVLIYSTCTYNQSEDENLVNWLKDDFGMQILRCEIPSQWGVVESESGCYHCYPHRVKGEGLFFAVLEKVTEIPEVIEKHGQKNTYFKQRSARQTELKEVKKTEVLDVVTKWIPNPNVEMSMLQLQDTFYCVQTSHLEFLSLAHDHLFIKKYPLKLGEKATGESIIFTPDQELALSQLMLDSDSKVPFTRLELYQNQALKYLSKQDMPEVEFENLESGFILLTFQNIPFGWGKKVGDRFQNLLPKNLVIRTLN